MYTAHIERVVKVFARANLFEQWIFFSDAVTVLYADHRLERRGYQIYTSTPIYPSPFEESISATVHADTGVWYQCL